MDPLEQRLIEAGATWRQSQPASPDLDRMVVALRGRRSGPMPRSLMTTFVAGLLLVAALAVAPAVGSFLHLLPPTGPVATATPSPAPSQPVATPEPSGPISSPVPSPSVTLTDAQTATQLVERYEAALVAGQWQTAFDLLLPTSATHDAGFASFQDERAAFFASVKGRYTLTEPTRVTSFKGFPPLVGGADRERAWLIEVDYPELAGNNAGFEQFVVLPDATGTWRIWPVR